MATVLTSEELNTDLNAGWHAFNLTPSFATSTTFTVVGDITNILAVGDKIKLTNNTLKYFYVTAASYSAPNTTVTVNGGTDYTLANAAITSPYYSKEASPNGFPQWFNYTPTLTSATVGNGTLISQFNMQGKLITYWGSWVLGSTSSVSSVVAISLPVNTSSSYLSGVPIGNGYADDSGVGTYAGPAIWASSSTINIFIPNGQTDTRLVQVTVGKPGTWSTGDSLRWTVSYAGA